MCSVRLPIPPASAETTDAELVERTREGDLSAFEELVERHRDVVFRVAARIAGREAAGDLSQDAFLRAYNHLAEFEGRGAFRSWILQITRNAALNEAVRRRPDPVGSPEELETPEPGDPRKTPAQVLEERERSERLESKLGELRMEHRTVLVLRDLEGLSYDEIAEITATPLGSVKGRIHRARNELIEILRSNTYDWELPRA